MPDRLETIEAYVLGAVGAIRGIYQVCIKEMIMEPLADHLQELAYERSQTGFEKRFVWDSVVEAAYTQIEDHATNERYNVFPKEGAHPKLTFERPQTQVIIHVGDEALGQTVEFEPVTGEHDGA